MNPRYMLALLVFSACASAQVYKWKDSNGNWQYSDQPPPGANQGKAKSLDLKDLPVSTMSSDKKDNKEHDAVVKPSTASAEASAAAQQKKLDPKACQDAKARLNFLEHANKLRMRNEKGETEFLPADKKAKEIVDVQQRIKEVCAE